MNANIEEPKNEKDNTMKGLLYVGAGFAIFILLIVLMVIISK
jgi:hypothetical protein